MKHVATLIAGLAAMLILASCFINGDEKEPVTKSTIIDELKEEGWEEIYVEPTGEDDNTYRFYVEAELIEGRPIMVEGSLVYDKWIEPVEMTAYGYQNGCYYEVGTWDELNDWVYTDFGNEFMHEVRHYVD